MIAAIEPKKITFKHTEAEWYNYHKTQKEIVILRTEITNPFDEEPEDIDIVKGANSVRKPGDPTGRIATRLATHKQLQYLQKITDAIDQVYNALPNDYKKMVRVRYWSKGNELSWDGIANRCNVSKRQAQRWRDEIIRATMEVLGWR